MEDEGSGSRNWLSKNWLSKKCAPIFVRTFDNRWTARAIYGFATHTYIVRVLVTDFLAVFPRTPGWGVAGFGEMLQENLCQNPHYVCQTNQMLFMCNSAVVIVMVPQQIVEKYVD